MVLYREHVHNSAQHRIHTRLSVVLWYVTESSRTSTHGGLYFLDYRKSVTTFWKYVGICVYAVQIVFAGKETNAYIDKHTQICK